MSDSGLGEDFEKMILAATRDGKIKWKNPISRRSGYSAVVNGEIVELSMDYAEDDHLGEEPLYYMHILQPDGSTLHSFRLKHIGELIFDTINYKNKNIDERLSRIRDGIK